MTTAISLPLISHATAVKISINPHEFWPAFPSIAYLVADLLGGNENRDRIPIFPLEDLKDKIHQYCCLSKTTIDRLEHPIEIYFLTNEKGLSGIAITYRIKRVKTPKWKCLAPKIQRAVEMITLVSPETSKTSSVVGRVVTAFGPASEPHAHLALLKKLFTERSYRSASTCFSLYKPTRVMLDE